MLYSQFEHLVLYYFHTYSKHLVNGLYTIIGLVLLGVMFIFTAMYFLSEYQEFKRRRAKRD
jgi:predicted PurR-regulated permease PerM